MADKKPGRTVKLLADVAKVKDLCDKCPSLADWNEKRAKCCGKSATVVEEDEEDCTIKLKFPDGFASWFPITAIIEPEPQKPDLPGQKTYTVVRNKVGAGWESLGLVTGCAGKPWTLIDSVKPGSAGARAGLSAGMSLSAINGQLVGAAGWDKFKEALGAAQGTLTVTVVLPTAQTKTPAGPPPAGAAAGPGAFGPPPGPPPPGAKTGPGSIPAGGRGIGMTPGAVGAAMAGPAPPPTGPSGPQAGVLGAAQAGPAPMPVSGPAMPTAAEVQAAAQALAEKQAKEAAEAAEELARQRSKAAQISALASALMQKFGQLGRLHLDGLKALFDVVGNPLPTRHEFRQCCLAFRGTVARGLGLDFLIELLGELPEKEEEELNNIARELPSMTAGAADGPVWEPPELTEEQKGAMIEARKRWFTDPYDCPRCVRRGCKLQECELPPRAVVIGDSHAREISELLANYTTSSGGYAFRVDAAPIVGASAQGLINPNSRTRARQKYLEAINSKGRDGCTHTDYLFIMIGSVDFDSVMFHKRDKKDRSWWYPQQIKASVNAVEKFLKRDVDYARVWKVVLVAIHPPPVEREDFFEQLNKRNHRNDEKDAGDRLGKFHAATLPELSERTRQASLYNAEMNRIVNEVNKDCKEKEPRAVLLSLWDSLIDKTTMTVYKHFRRQLRTDTHLRFDALQEHYAGLIRKTLNIDCMSQSHRGVETGDTGQAPGIEAGGEVGGAGPQFNPALFTSPPPPGWVGPWDPAVHAQQAAMAGGFAPAAPGFTPPPVPAPASRASAGSPPPTVGRGRGAEIIGDKRKAPDDGGRMKKGPPGGRGTGSKIADELD